MRLYKSIVGYGRRRALSHVSWFHEWNDLRGIVCVHVLTTLYIFTCSCTYLHESATPSDNVLSRVLAWLESVVPGRASSLVGLNGELRRSFII